MFKEGRNMSMFRGTKSLEELQEQDESLTSEVSIAEKRAAIKRLKQEGLSPKHFGFNWSAIREWIKSH